MFNFDNLSFISFNFRQNRDFKFRKSLPILIFNFSAKSKSSIPWKRFEVLFHNLLFSPISIINSLLDLIKFEEIIINFLISLWIQPLFTIIPLNSN